MKIFLDASVILAGLASKTGGSRILLLSSEKGKLKVVTSNLVLEEVKRNIKKKFGENELIKFAKWLKTAKPGVVNVAEKEINRYKELVASKDAHVLAASHKSKAKYLATLDKKHLLKLKGQSSLPFNIVTPGELINLLQFEYEPGRKWLSRTT